jgi:hypothetical protein
MSHDTRFNSAILRIRSLDGRTDGRTDGRWQEDRKRDISNRCCLAQTGACGLRR